MLYCSQKHFITATIYVIEQKSEELVSFCKSRGITPEWNKSSYSRKLNFVCHLWSDLVHKFPTAPIVIIYILIAKGKLKLLKGNQMWDEKHIGQTYNA